MKVKSLSDCLNKIDNMIYNKTFKYPVKDDLELIRNHMVWYDVIDTKHEK